MEIIICAAININWVIIVWKRHWNCFSSLSGIYAESSDVPRNITHWFRTNRFRFINRKEAFNLAKENWQLKKEERDRKDKDLYSEDLY